jgi:flagellar basal-body rod protein FlgG
MQPGALQATGQSLDLALAGDGFFEVATAHGPAYTRQGNLHLDARSRLVTAAGDAVMGQGGEIVLGTGAATVDAAGNITDQASGRQLGRLRIVRFDPAVRPQALGDGLWAEAPGMREVADAERDVRQGYLERSNVNSTQEMVRLMQTMRHFESVQRVVQGYDDMLGTAIRKLGDA